MSRLNKELPDEKYDALIQSIIQEKEEIPTPDEEQNTKIPWYRKFLARRLLTSMRKHLVKKHELKNRERAMKLVLALEELFDIPKLDSPNETYNREELKELNAKQLASIIERATHDLEELL